MTEPAGESRGKITVDRLKKFIECQHEWVNIEGSGPRFGGLEDRPMLFSVKMRCLKCGATTRSVRSM
jgi:hypothetical protein